MAARPMLPRPLTVFFGRERELHDIAASLEDSRLVTLAGPGGVGKTRLAVEAARSDGQRFPDGPFFVDLAPLHDRDGIPGTIQAAMGVEEARKGVEALANLISDREVLLILDNCEQIVEPLAILAEGLLGDCPRLRLLCTSREPLGIPGERVWRVAPLDVPEGEASPLSDLSRFPCVQLFVDRARLANPAFELTEENARPVLAILRAVDGLPLATELAAARLRALPVDQVASRLAERLPLLAGGARTAPDRQRTMAAAVAWSHDLLSEREKVLFRRLAIFNGGWTLEAAEGVCTFGELSEADIFPLLEALVDRSLVVALLPEGRFRFLEVILEFARNQLLASDELDRVGSSHLQWFANVAERADQETFGPANAFWRQRLEAEHENCLAAVEWAATHPSDLGAGLQLVSCLHFYWMQWMNLEEALGHIRRLLDVDGIAPPAWRIRALAAAAWFSASDPVAGRRFAVAALDLARELRDEALLCRALDAVARAAVLRLDSAEMREAGTEALRLAKRTGEWAAEVRSHVHVAISLEEEGQTAPAALHYQQALAVAESRQSRSYRSLLLCSLGENRRIEGDLAAAELFYREGLAAARAEGQERIALLNQVNLGATLTLAGRVADGADEMCHALRSAVRLGEPELTLIALLGIAVHEANDGDPGLAARLIGVADAQPGHGLQAQDRQVRDVGVEVCRRKLRARFDAEYEQGQRWNFQAAVREVLAAANPRDLPTEALVPARLSPREIEILRLVAQGKTNRDIAEELVLSRRTVENHIANAYAKVGATNRAEATRFAIEQGLVQRSRGQ